MGLIKKDGMWTWQKYVDGKPRRVSTGFQVGPRAHHEAAKRRAAELELEYREKRLGWRKDIPTVAEWWDTYRAAHGRTKGERTQVRDEGTMRLHALPFFGKLRLDEVRKSDCLNYLQKRRESLSAHPTRKTPTVISEGTVQRERSLLQAVFQQAVEDGHLARNPWAKIERVPDEVRDRVVSSAEQEELLRRLSPEYRRWLLFMIGTGLRLEECIGIDPARDIDWEDRQVTVTGKGNKVRTVPLPIPVMRVLEEQMAEEGELWTCNQQRFREILMLACRGREATPARVSRRGRLVPAREARATLEHISPHALRHTYGHRWLKGGGDIYTLSKILGHASVAVTSRHYAHLLRDDLRAAVDRIDLGVGA